jgi:hypothetical protein
MLCKEPTIVFPLRCSLILPQNKNVSAWFSVEIMHTFVTNGGIQAEFSFGGRIRRTISWK